MAEREQQDPAATTQQFRAFAKQGEGAEAQRSSRMSPAVIIGALAVGVVVVLGAAYALMGGL